MTINLRFATTSDVFGLAVRSAQYGTVPTKVDVVLPDGMLVTVGQNGVAKVVDGYDAAIAENQFRMSLASDFGQDAGFISFINSQVGKPADNDPIGPVPFNRNWQTGSKWFAAELVTCGLQVAGWFNKIPDGMGKIMPRDLIMMLGAHK